MASEKNKFMFFQEVSLEDIPLWQLKQIDICSKLTT